MRFVVLLLATLGVALVSAPAWSDDHAPAVERALTDAWHLLRVDRQPENAATRYQALLARDDLTRLQRARATVGLAEAERLQGRHARADALMTEVVERYPELRALQAGAASGRRASGQGGQGPVWGHVRLPQGMSLDLDTGGTFPGRSTWTGGASEVWHDALGVSVVRGAEVDVVPGRVLVDPGTASWRRMPTDQGRLAWVQVLDHLDPPAIRFIVQDRARARLLGDAGVCFAVGASDHIDIHIGGRSTFDHYRVEVARGPDASFEMLDANAQDRARLPGATEGMRYRFRVTGVDAEGRVGLPTRLLGTTTSRGVRGGVVGLRRGQGVDVLTNEVVDQGGDLRLVAMYGNNSGAGIDDASGRRIQQAATREDAPRSVWDARSTRHPYLENGERFVASLEGGGIVRGRVVLRRREGRGAPEAELHYEVWTDGSQFPAAPSLRIQAEPDRGVRIRVADLASGSRVPFVHALDAGEIGAGRRVDRQPDGTFLDPVPLGSASRRYRATPVDEHGRRGVSAEAWQHGTGNEIRRGTFRFHYRQGYSFARQEIVDGADADVVFTRAAGGISSVELSAPGGILNLDRIVPRRGPGPRLLAERVVGADPSALRLRADADGDDREPSSDVFILRVPSGGWARLAIVDRSEEGSWTNQLVTVEYVWNPREPRFEANPDKAPEVTEKGVVMIPQAAAMARRRARALGHLEKTLRTGEAVFHYRQGYSFEGGRIVPAEEADVVFASCAGGIASVTLTAAGGIRTLPRSLEKTADGLSVDALLDAIVGVDEAAWFSDASRRHGRASTRADADSREPTSNVFVLQTRNGAWVKCAIVERHDGKGLGWQETPITLRYAFHPAGAVFDDEVQDALPHQGLLLSGPLAARLKNAPGPSSAAPTPKRRPGPEGGAERSGLPGVRLEAPPSTPPPLDWLAPYGSHEATMESLDRLRRDVLRSRDDALVMRVLVWLSEAQDPRYRRAAATALTGAHLLGDQAGPGIEHAIRTLARDPDPATHRAAYAGLQVHDSVLRREIFAAHVRGEIPIPEGKAWDAVRSAFRTYAWNQDGDALREQLQDKDQAAAWIRAAYDRPVQGDENPFVVLDVKVGSPVLLRLDESDGELVAPKQQTRVEVSDIRVIRGTSPPHAADHHVVTLRSGGMTSVGGAKPYMTGRSGVGGETMSITSRVIADDTVRVWVRRRPVVPSEWHPR